MIDDDVVELKFDDNTVHVVVPAKMEGLGLILSGILCHFRTIGSAWDIFPIFNPEAFTPQEQDEVCQWASHLYREAMFYGPDKSPPRKW